MAYNLGHARIVILIYDLVLYNLVCNWGKPQELQLTWIDPQIIRTGRFIPLKKGSVMWSFHNSFVVSLNKVLNKQSSCCWFETQWETTYAHGQQKPRRLRIFLTKHEGVIRYTCSIALIDYHPVDINDTIQATGLDAWASRVKCPARFVSHLHEICIYIYIYMSCL